MSDNTRGGKIFDPKDADFLESQGKESQQRRKDEDAKKLMEKAGKESQERRGKGNFI